MKPAHDDSETTHIITSTPAHTPSLTRILHVDLVSLIFACLPINELVRTRLISHTCATASDGDHPHAWQHAHLLLTERHAGYPLIRIVHSLRVATLRHITLTEASNPIRLCMCCQQRRHASALVISQAAARARAPAESDADSDAEEDHPLFAAPDEKEVDEYGAQQDG